MDAEVIRALKDAGIDTTFKKTVPGICIMVDETGRPKELGEEVMVISGEKIQLVRLKPITQLFSGDAVPPDFRRGPTPEYMMFFALIERTAADFCSSTRRTELDKEFQRLYRLLGKRPDGRDRNPLFSQLQGAVRLYMSLRDASRAEFEAVAARLSKSARTFSDGYSSTNYLDLALRLLG